MVDEDEPMPDAFTAAEAAGPAVPNEEEPHRATASSLPPKQAVTDDDTDTLSLEASESTASSLPDQLSATRSCSSDVSPVDVDSLVAEKDSMIPLRTKAREIPKSVAFPSTMDVTANLIDSSQTSLQDVSLEDTSMTPRRIPSNLSSMSTPKFSNKSQGALLQGGPLVLYHDNSMSLAQTTQPCPASQSLLACHSGSCRSCSNVDDEATVTRSNRLLDLVTSACPCCHQSLDEPGTLLSQNNDILLRQRNRSRQRSAMSLDDDNDEIQDSQQKCSTRSVERDDDALPGVLAAGVKYKLTRCLVEGWLHKKGTGKDWLGSRSWKARWARLCMARVQSFYQGGVDVPLLCIYWYPTSADPSTVILLDSTVVMGISAPDLADWNAFRFEIRHASTQQNETIPVTRTFAASPRKARDAWVYSISQALLAFEKEKAAHSKLQQQAGGSLSPMRTSNEYNEIWTGDRFVQLESPTERNASPAPHQISRTYGMSSPPRPNTRATSPTSTR